MYPRWEHGIFIYDGVTLGENVVIMEPSTVSIGEGTVIDANTVIYPNTVIGENVHISSNCVVGSNGFIFRVEENKLPQREVTLGKVVLEDGVDVGACNTIDAGRKQTILRKGCKTDNLCQIAHDCDLGEGVLMAAGSILGGHVTIGKNTRLGLNCTVRNRAVIGADCFIGMGVSLIKDTKDNVKVTVFGTTSNNKKGYI